MWDAELGCGAAVCAFRGVGGEVGEEVGMWGEFGEGFAGEGEGGLWVC